ncbi:hypothetical protein GCM10017600_50390 [Streptosporangium carneum]|uniref:NB-ARC domain-containing protein n=1 Tax=Streptosporangium carneum TaxID=47481 RepID=A0A9W6I4P3_9ACTN|nr:hypothetical protein GCM10017600_50390 [Streptosporangium carneum]
MGRDQHIHLTPPLSWPRVAGEPPGEVSAFQPRPEDDRAVLEHDRLTGVRSLVLTGPGGTGKTQLAARWVRRAVERRTDLIVWADASSADALVSTLAEAARLVRAPGAEDGTDAATAARALLTWLAGTDRSWLVVFDDIQEPDQVLCWWPEVGRGTVLGTTRRRDAKLTGKGRRLVQVGVFDAERARAYLRERLTEAGHPNLYTEPAAAELADALGGLPLALGHAAGYMIHAAGHLSDEENGCAAYLRRFRDRGLRLREVLPPEGDTEDYGRLVDVTLLLGLDAARQSGLGGYAEPTLQAVALLDPSGHPRAVWDFLDEVRLADPAQSPPAADPVPSALSVMHRLGLVTRDGEVVRMHALTGRAVRETMTESDGVTVLAAGALLAVWPASAEATALGRTLRANAAVLAEHTGARLWTVAGVPEMLFRAGQDLGMAGHAADAVTHWRRLLESGEAHLGPDHRHTLRARLGLATWLGPAGDHRLAVTELAALVVRMSEALGADDELTLTARNVHARARGAAGDKPGALAGFEALLPDAERVLSADHEITLSTRTSIGVWRGENGDPWGAVAALEPVLARQREVFGDDHPLTLTTLNNIAAWRGKGGDHVGAAAELRTVAVHRARVIGPDHPLTLTTWHSHAHNLAESGDPGQALVVLREVLENRIRVFGPDHPDVLIAHCDIGHWSGQVGDAAGAVESFTTALETALRRPRPDPLEIIGLRRQVADWRAGAGDLAGAATELERALDDCEELVGPHPEFLPDMLGLVGLRTETGDAAGVVAAWERILRLRRLFPGPDHEDLADALQRVAAARLGAGDTAGAVAGFTQHLDLLLRTRGPGDPLTHFARNNLAEARGLDGDIPGAVAEFERLLAELERWHPDEEFTAFIRKHLGTWRARLRDSRRPSGSLLRRVWSRLRAVGNLPRTAWSRFRAR